MWFIFSFQELLGKTLYVVYALIQLMNRARRIALVLEVIFHRFPIRISEHTPKSSNIFLGFNQFPPANAGKID
jgi:hypothetical protein